MEYLVLAWALIGGCSAVWEVFCEPTALLRQYLIAGVLGPCMGILIPVTWWVNNRGIPRPVRYYWWKHTSGRARFQAGCPGYGWEIYKK